MKVKLLLLFFLCLTSVGSYSQLQLIEKENQYYIKTLEILDTRVNSLLDTQVTSGIADTLFQSYSIKSHVLKGGTYWLKFSIKNNSVNQNDWLLEFFDFKISYLSFYTKGGSQQFENLPSGYHLPFSNKELSHKNLAFPLRLKPGEEKTYYVKISSRKDISLIIVVRTFKEFVRYALREYLILGVYYGIIVLVILLNLFLFFTSRDKAYLLYVYYVMSIGLFSLTVVDGIAFQYLWPSHPEYNKFIGSFASLSMVVSALLYARAFLLLNKLLPWMDKLILGVILLRILVFISEVFLDFNTASNHVLDWATLTVAFVSGIVSLSKGFSPARYYVIAFSFLFLGYFIFTLSTQGIIISNYLSVYAINYAMVAEIILLSMALAERLKTFKLEKEKAQKEKMDQLLRNEMLQDNVIFQLRENEQLKDKVNQELEQKVSERTRALSAAQEQIEKINLLLQADNLHLQSNVKALHNDRVMQKQVSFEEFKNIYPDEKACFEFLENLKWGKGFKCLQCGHVKFAKGNMPYSRRCSKCGLIESVMAGTIFYRLKFPLLKAFYMIFLVHGNPKITSEELSQVLELRKQTCWAFKKKVLIVKDGKLGNRKNLNGWSNLILLDEEKLIKISDNKAV